MINNNNNFVFGNEDKEEEEYNFIQGVKITDEEQQKITDLINFDYVNKKFYELYDIVPVLGNLFKEHDLIKFHVLNFDYFKIKNKNYIKYEGDTKIYLYSNLSYLENKKQLFLYFERLLLLLNNHIKEDIKDYLHSKFLKNIGKCKFYDCKRWFICLFIYWFNSIRKPELYFHKIDYKDFRKYIIKYRTNKTEFDLVKDILIEFNNINISYAYYEELKIFLNYSLYKILDGYYILR